MDTEQENTEYQEIHTELPKPSAMPIIITIGIVILTIIGIVIINKTTTKPYTRQEVIDKIKELLDTL